MQTRALIFVGFIVLVVAAITCAILPLTAHSGTTQLASAVQTQSPASLESASSEAVPQQQTAGTAKVDAVSAVARTNDPYFDLQWALYTMPSGQINASSGGSGTIVAVLDTGVDSGHEDLQGKVIDARCFSQTNGFSDVNGHGTHVAGIIAAIADNNIGIKGAAPDVKLLNGKVAEDSGLVWESNVAQGITWAVDRGALVINMSLAAPSKSAALVQAIEYAWSRGVVLVAAAGNYNRGLTYPAAIPEVIAVAALNKDGTVWSDSNDGDFIDVYAPGVEIYSTLPHDSYGYYNGSSMAAAYVSAVSAMAFNAVSDEDGDGYLNDEVVEMVTGLFDRP